MRVFTYTPGAERLREFNERLIAFCDEEAVVDISAQAFGNSAVISCVTADDVLAIPGQPVVVAMLRELTADTNVEAYLNKVIEDFDPEDEDAPVPVKIALMEKPNKPGCGSVLFVCINGALDPAGEGEDGEGEDDEDDDEDDDGEGDEGGEGAPIEPERVTEV